LYRLVIFDFDGTLVDSAPGIVQVMEQVVVEFDLTENHLSEWTHLIGVPLNQQMAMITPDKPGEYHDALAARYREIYDSKAIEICPPFPGLAKLLEDLHNSDIHMAIASSKRRNLIEPVLEFHDISKYFKLVVGPQDVKNHKPHPESVHFTLETLEQLHDHAIVIGDSKFDLDMAANAGVDAIGVTTGIHSKEILSGSNPNHIVEKIHDILPIILAGKQLRKTA
jgi:HAD superfamily hydrolase (TIGR01509 family)